MQFGPRVRHQPEKGNAYMDVANMQSGSQIAAEPRKSSAQFADTGPSKLTELLELLENDPPQSLPMLRSTASKIAEFYNIQTAEITLDQVYAMRGQFRRYLKSRKYAEGSVRSYVNFLRILVDHARRSGWRPYRNLPQEWQRLLALAAKRRCSEVVRSVAVVRVTPHEVTLDDVDAWGETALSQGSSIRLVKEKKARFWRLLKDCQLTDQQPLSFIRAQPYRVPFDRLPPQLRSELQRILDWKTANFQLGRPKGGKIRQVTAEIVKKMVCQLFGFATAVRGLPSVESLSELVREDLIADYASWCINERSVKGETLRNHLGRLDVAMRQHPSYASLDLRWFKSLLESLPAEPESERRMRKAKKYLDYSVMEAIPGAIRAERLSATDNRDAAVLAMEELLITWLLALPWRQRNIRECRIGGSRPNIFKARIPTHLPIDIPGWVLSQDQRNPGEVFWQMHFLPQETKTSKEIHAFVPRPLVGPLEEYLAVYRPKLLRNGDPGTLFVTKHGSPMRSNNVHSIVTRITSRFGGRAVNPHLIRDIVAFAWLKTHPKDYLTLSKILWHANINVTIKTYGSRFDESSGVCAMESWLEERAERANSK